MGTPQKYLSRAKTQAVSSSSSTPTAHEDEQSCYICADHAPKYWVVGECNHPVCWMCSLRIRILYGKLECPMCKVHNETVWVGREKVGWERAGRSVAAPQKRMDKERGLVFETAVIERAVQDLLQLSCPFPGCRPPNAESKNVSSSLCTFKSKADLRRHCSTQHHLSLCDICLTHKKVFSVEMKLFNSAGLQKHHGDHHPGCKICGTSFFGEEELMQHYREKHERCHVCWKRDPQSAPYYRDYTSLVQILTVI